MEPNERPEAESKFNPLVALAILIGIVIWWERMKTPVVFMVTLGVLVAIHEWGHLIAAKASGVRVYEFAIGFGPRLFTYLRRGGTDYTFRAIPLGGFVNPKGMQPDDPIASDGINGRRPAERALVYLAGPLMNVILGVVVLCLVGFLFGVPDERVVLIGDVDRKEPASRMEVRSVNGAAPEPDFPAGLRVGDRILAVNGQPVSGREAVIQVIHTRPDQEVTLTIQRRDAEIVLAGTPRRREIPGEFLTVVAPPEPNPLGVQPGDQIDYLNGQYVYGEAGGPVEFVQNSLAELEGTPVTLVVWRNGEERIELSGPAAPVTVAVRESERRVGALGFSPTSGVGARASFGESVRGGFADTQGFFVQLGRLFSRPRQLGENVGSPIAIWQILGQVDRLPTFYYAMILAHLSLSLAVFNLLPIPVLDGGHMFLLTLEVLRRRRLGPDAQRLAMLVGLAIIGVIFIFVISKDVMKYFL